MIEVTAVHAHQPIELPLAGMAERRMADVVDQRERFGELGIQAENRGHGASNLRDLQRVCQAVAEMVGIAGRKDLRLSFETAESAGMDDAVAVTRVGAAVGMRRLLITPATRLLRAHRPRSRSGRSIDGPLRSVPADPREGSFAKQVKISAKAWPSRDPLHRRRWCPGIPS